jgi:molybdopterin converting factor small subunit
MNPTNAESEQEMRTVLVKFANHFRDRTGVRKAMVRFQGRDLRALVDRLLEDFDIEALLLEDGEIAPYVRVVINGRYSSLLGGWQARIPDGATVVLLGSYVIAF